MALPYPILNKFYEGKDEYLRTPFTSAFMNTIIKQVEDNDYNLDTRISTIEKNFNEDTFNVSKLNTNELTSKISKISSLSNDDLTSKNINSDNISSKNLKVDTSVINNIINENIKSSNLAITVGSAEKFVVNEFYTEHFKISNNYVLNPSTIDFYTNKESIIFHGKENTETGISFQNEVNNLSNKMDIKTSNKDSKTTAEISFISENKNDEFIIKTNVNFTLDTKNLNVNNINPLNENTNIGSLEKPFQKLYAKEIYGSFYSISQADIAELYETSDFFEPGTIVQIGKEFEGEIADGTRPVLGVVTNVYGYLLNKELENKTITSPIALKGRIPVKLSNKGKRGDKVIVDKNNPGYGKCIDFNIISNDNEFVGYLIDPELNIIKV